MLRSVLRRATIGVVVSLGVVACGIGCAPGPTLPARAEVASTTTQLSPLARVGPAPISATTVEAVKLAWDALPGGFARAVAVSSRVDRAVFASDKVTRVYNLTSGSPTGTLNTCADVVRGGMFFHEAKLVVVCREAVQRFDVLTPKQLAPPEVQAVPITAAALAGDRLALAQRDGVIRVHDLKTNSVVEVVVPGPPIDVKSLALDAAGQRVAVAWVQGSIWWWQMSDPGRFHKLVRHDNESDSVAFANDGTFAEEGESGATSLWTLDPKGPEKLGELKNGAWIKRLLFSSDSKWLVRGGADGLELAEVGGPKRLVLDAAGQVEDVALDESGSVIVSGDRVGRLTCFRVKR